MARVIPIILGFLGTLIGIDTTDPTQWFTETATLSVVVAAVVAYLRQHVLKDLDGIRVVFTSIGTGALLGVTGNVAGFLTGTLPEAIAFGVAAGWLASGGIDALRAVFGSKSPEA